MSAPGRSPKRSKTGKIVAFASDKNYEQLFDLKNDPRETRNVAGDPAYAETLARLRAKCDEYRRSLE